MNSKYTYKAKCTCYRQFSTVIMPLFTTKDFTHMFLDYMLDNDFTSVFLLGSVNRFWRAETVEARQNLRDFFLFNYIFFYDTTMLSKLRESIYQVMMTGALPLLIEHHRYRSIVQNQVLSWKKSLPRLVYLLGQRRIGKTTTMARFAATLNIVRPDIKIMITTHDSIFKHKEMERMARIFYDRMTIDENILASNSLKKFSIKVIPGKHLCKSTIVLRNSVDILFADDVVEPKRYLNYLDKYPSTISIVIPMDNSNDKIQATIPYLTFLIMYNMPYHNRDNSTIDTRLICSPAYN